MILVTPDEIRTFLARRQAKFPVGDAAALAADYAEDGTLETLSTGTHRGRREIEEFFQRWTHAFPGMGYTIQTVVAEDDRAAVFFVLSGTHAGSFLGLPATDKPVEIPVARVIRFANDLIAHDQFTYDFSGLLIKLGMLKVSKGW